MYRSLKAIYFPTGDQWRIEWEIQGIVSGMEEAKRRYGGNPVLEFIR